MKPGRRFRRGFFLVDWEKGISLNTSVLIVDPPSQVSVVGLQLRGSESLSDLPKVT